MKPLIRDFAFCVYNWQIIACVACVYGLYEFERESKASERVKCSNSRVKTVCTRNPCNNLIPDFCFICVLRFVSTSVTFCHSAMFTSP